MSFWDIANSDLDAVFDTGGFAAVNAVWNGAITVPVLFFKGYEDAIREDGGIASSGPEARVRSSDVVGIQQGDTFEIGGTVYKVVNPEPDGTGVTVLKLSR
jgi:hypothetical protein